VSKHTSSSSWMEYQLLCPWHSLVTDDFVAHEAFASASSSTSASFFIHFFHFFLFFFVIMPASPKLSELSEMQWSGRVLTKRQEVTMKQLIQKLHITQPRELVMKILGVKYPGSEETFKKSGLPGEWDPELGQKGRRMRLETPLTWEVLLSQKGNSAESWEYLLDQKKLPFLALLRNLRNMLICGISPKHIGIVIASLKNEQHVIASKVLPTQFMLASEALDINLNKLGKIQKFVSKEKKKEKTILQREKDQVARGILSEIEAQKSVGKRLKLLKARVKKLFGINQAVLPKLIPTKKSISDLKGALDIAVKVSTNHNMDQIRGFTLILCDVGSSMKFPIGHKKANEIGLLLSLLLHNACEKSEIYLFPGDDTKLRIDEDANIFTTLSKLKNLESGDQSNFPYAVIDKMMKQRFRVDNVVLISSMLIKSSNLQRKDFVNPLVDQLARFRKSCNEKMFFFAVDLAGKGLGVVDFSNGGYNESLDETPKIVDGNNEYDARNDLITGFSAQIISYIASKNNTQLDHIEAIIPEA